MCQGSRHIFILGLHCSVYYKVVKFQGKYELCSVRSVHLDPQKHRVLTQLMVAEDHTREARLVGSMMNDVIVKNSDRFHSHT